MRQKTMSFGGGTYYLDDLRLRFMRPHLVNRSLDFFFFTSLRSSEHNNETSEAHCKLWVDIQLGIYTFNFEHAYPWSCCNYCKMIIKLEIKESQIIRSHDMR